MVLVLTQKGSNLLEKAILEAFAENPREIRKAFEVLGMDLDSFLERNVGGYNGAREFAVRRLGVEPDYWISRHVRKQIRKEEELMYGRSFSFT